MSTIIIGAGAAGITAGYTLLQEGFSNFIILEASSTYLGRIKKIDNFTNHPIDLGGEFIHVNPTILDTIINDPNVNIENTVVTTPYSPNYKEYDGTQLNDATLPSGDYKFVNYTWYDFFDTYIVPDVMNKITFNCAVSQIEWITNTSTTVTCQNGQVYNGTKTIITVPMSILQDNDITFLPSLPSNFITAINVPTMAAGLKVFLRFTTKFYPDAFTIDSDYNNIVLDESDRFFFDETYGQIQPLYNILAVFILGDLADEYISLSDEDIIQLILDDLNSVFGNNVATTTYITGIVQNWSTEPYIRGGYTVYEDKGYLAIDTLRVPISNVLYFAGEAIPVEESDYANGFIHGAALSGRQAAMDTLNGATPPTSSAFPRLTCIWNWFSTVIMSLLHFLINIFI